MTLFRSLLNDKMKERFNVHSTGDFSILHDSVGKDVLPEEYGGTNGTLKDHNDELISLMESKLGWLKEQTKFKADESKRPGKPKNYSEIFGMEGSFRQLSVD